MTSKQSKNKDKSIKASAALGGSTSIDIYPKGWDKTYVVNHLDRYQNIYFVGDKCDPGGNDFELYEFLKGDEACKSFKTSDPFETEKIIREDIILSFNTKSS